MKKLTIFALALVVLASCNKKENNFEQPYNGELRITSGIATRAVDQTWESGDKIGVTMFESGATVAAIGKANTPYSTTSNTTSANFAVVSTDVDLYYPQSGFVDIFAYYPYADDVNARAYEADVTDQSDLAAIDLMVSTNIILVAKTKTAQPLVFSHKLSKVVVTLSPKVGGGLTADDLAAATVTISNTKAVAIYNLYTDAIRFDENTAVDLSVTAESGVATAIVIPQIAKPKFTITLANGDTFNVTAASSIDFTSGKQHDFPISVTRTAAALDRAVITPWDTEYEDDLEANDLP